MGKHARKWLSLTLALIMVLGLLPVSAFAAQASASEDKPAVLHANQNTYGTIEIYLENKDVWLVSDDLLRFSYYMYGLFDLEGDGIPELFSSGIGGSGFFSDNHFYQVDVAARTVSEMEDLSDTLGNIDLQADVGIYQNSQTGQLLYHCRDIIRNGVAYHATLDSFFYKADGTVFMKNAWAEDCTVGANNVEQYKYYYYNDGGDRVEVSKEDWDRYKENYLAQYTLIADKLPLREAEKIHGANNTALKKIFKNMYDELYDLDTIADETILRAKLLATDHRFDFYRSWESPVQIMAEQLDPYSAAAWYTIENLLETYYKSLTTLTDPGDVSSIEFYEYLLLCLLDSDDQEWLSISEPFGMLNHYAGTDINSVMIEKLASAGVEITNKVTEDSKGLLKEITQAICGIEDSPDIGWLDSLLVTGKSMDAFASEVIKIYALTSVSDARAEAVKMIGEHTQKDTLKKAANNVYASIQQAKKDCVSYCVLGGTASGLSEINLWLMDKIVDQLCKLHPASKIWKTVAEATTFSMDTIFKTNDIATDTIRILAMANVEKALLSAIDQTEDAFLSSNDLEDAQQYLAMADTLKQELLVGCDLVLELIAHTEQGDPQWNGLDEKLSMEREKLDDFGGTIKWIFGDEDSEYEQLRKSVSNIRKTIENANFYAGSVSVLELLREVRTKTPSSWATAEVNKAINYGFLPSVMQNNYQTNITRIEFCALLEYMIESKTGKTALELADELAQQQGGYIKPPFDDALYMEVNDVARLGIISGIGNNLFSPLGEITRQEAATMLYRTANVLGYDASAEPTGFSGVADWAASGVDFVSDRGIMNGSGNGFDPLGKYTKEQAVLTMVRFYENVK